MELGISLDTFNNKMKTDFIIIGGGIAGLSAANRLADEGAAVTLLEAGNYPSHKICGEFLSPEALPILEKWEIAPAARIPTIRFVMAKKQCLMHLSQQAAMLQRYDFDEKLARRAEKKGVCLQTNTKVTDIIVPKQDEDYVVTLVSGEQWKGRHLLVSTGRWQLGRAPKYIGVKAHFVGIKKCELVMHLFPKAYFGIAPIREDRVNVAGILACSAQEIKDPKGCVASFFAHPDRQGFFHSLGQPLFDWLIGVVPEFGVQETPRWPRAFFLGDAAGVIPPATGNGLAMGLTSGILAAEYALRYEAQAFRIRWKQEYNRRIARGMLLHRLFLSSWGGMIPTMQLFPFLPRYFFRATRGT